MREDTHTQNKQTTTNENLVVVVNNGRRGMEDVIFFTRGRRRDF